MKLAKKKSIWIADDDPDDRLMLKEAFEEYAYPDPLVFFEDGEKVVEILRKKERAMLKPSLILLDLNMPKVNGHEVLSFIKNNHRTRNIPVIILTTSKSEEDKKAVMKMGASGFITKPYRLTEMIKIAGELIESYG